MRLKTLNARRKVQALQHGPVNIYLACISSTGHTLHRYHEIAELDADGLGLKE